MKRIVTLVFAAMLSFGLFSSPADALTIDTQVFDTSAECAGNCFGATYTLVVTDANDANPNTFTATLTVAIGTYTGTMTHIGAVDIKPGNVTGATLTDFSVNGASQGTGGWTTTFTTGQAAGNCLNGLGGFLCSRDTDQNTLAPTSNNTTYEWEWSFTLNGGYEFGHLGVNYTVANDSCTENLKGTKVISPDCLQDGENISISKTTTDGGTPSTDTPRVPEPAALLLLGSGLFVFRRLIRRRSA